jgi:hypothetical protein
MISGWRATSPVASTAQWFAAAPRGRLSAITIMSLFSAAEASAGAEVMLVFISVLIGFDVLLLLMLC